MVEPSLRFQVVSVKAAAQENMPERSDLMIVAERVNLRPQHSRVDLRVSVFAAQMVRAGKISCDAQPAEKTVIRISAPAHHIEPGASWISRSREVRERPEQNTAAQFQP